MIQTRLKSIENNLKTYKPRKIPGRRWMVRSSVSALLTNQENPLVILIRRPVKSGDPWSGDMCFPGGRQDVIDKNSFATALRETEEEVGLDLETEGTYLGRLSDILTRAHEVAKPMVITPFVFSVRSEEQLAVSEEAQEIIAVPLEFLGSPVNRKTMRWLVGPVNMRVPCYHYRGTRIWGLTLMMLDELVRLSGGSVPAGDNWLRMAGLRD